MDDNERAAFRAGAEAMRASILVALGEVAQSCGGEQSHQRRRRAVALRLAEAVALAEEVVKLRREAVEASALRDRVSALTNELRALRSRTADDRATDHE